MYNINYKEYLKSDYWLSIREQVYERDNHKCKLCDSGKHICVHHLSYENLYNERLEDLITLCRKCHYIIHKQNPYVNYQSYVYYQALKEKEDKYKKFKYIFIQNINKMVEIYNNIQINNYIKLNDLSKILLPIFEDKCCVEYFLEQFNLILIFDMFDGNHIYWFPKGVSLNNPIVITKDLYRQHKQDLMILFHSYNFTTTDIHELFEQGI